MPFVPAENVIQANVRYTLHGQQIENVTYWRTAATPTAANVETLAAGLLDRWGEFVMPLLSQDLLLREVYASSLDTFDGPTATATFEVGPQNGGIANAGLPGNVALCVSLRTAFRGRSRRGRLYIPGLYETAVIGNVVIDTVAASIATSISAVGSDLAPEGFEHVVISRISEGNERTTALVTTVTSYIVTDNVVDSQRRRLTGRGN